MRNAVVVAALVSAVSMNAQGNKAALYDSTQVEALQEVVVKGVRAQKNAPYAIANIKKQQLDEFSKTGKELPMLFSQTPGVMAWSENGLGTGTTYMRIRGAGDSRINVTLDGVPLNSPEDQCVFWANMNSYGSLLAVCRSSEAWEPLPMAMVPSEERLHSHRLHPLRRPASRYLAAMVPITPLILAVSSRRVCCGTTGSSTEPIMRRIQTASSMARADALALTMGASPGSERISRSVTRTSATSSGQVRLGTV
jgi:hypothetical protein